MKKGVRKSLRDEMNIPLAPIRYKAVTMELAAHLDEQCVEMNILTDMGKVITIVCDKGSILSVKRHIENIDRACPEISTWKSPAQNGSHFRGSDRSLREAALIYKRKIGLYEQASHLQESLITWVLIADSRRAQIYECTKRIRHAPLWATDKRDEDIQKLCLQLKPIPYGIIEAEFLTGPGFAEAISNKLQAACTENFFDHLVLAAPQHMIDGFMKQLPVEVVDRVVIALPQSLGPNQDHAWSAPVPGLNR